MEETTINQGIVLNIYDDNENKNNVWIKFLTRDQILNIKVKGFNNISNKNRNINIGSVYQLEVFSFYGSKNKKLLKKIKSFIDWDETNYETTVFFQKLFWILQIIEKPLSEEVFNFYLEIISRKEEQQNKLWFLTYFLNNILVNQYNINKMQFCIKCNSNRNIYAINMFEGIICYEDYQKLYNKTEWTKELQLIKSFYFLNTSFQKYVGCTNSTTNKNIYLILKNMYSYLN